MISSLLTRNSFKGLFYKYLILIAFLINQQRVGATHFKSKHSDSCFLVTSIYSDISLLNSAEQMSF
jgi:hypothetical protein